MAYEPTIWKDRAVENPRTYTIQENSDGTVTLVPAPGIIEDPGTPVNAANLNKLEQGLKTHEADNAQHSLKSPILKGVPTIFPWVMPGWAFAAMSNLPAPAGEIWYIPIYISDVTAFKSVSLIVNTAVASTSVEVRLYDIDPVTTLPKNEILNFGILDTSTTGIKEILNTFTLEAGYYFIGVKFNGSPNLKSFTKANTLLAPMSSRTLNSGVYTTTSTYVATGSMNNPATTPTTFSMNDSIPAVFFKL